MANEYVIADTLTPQTDKIAKDLVRVVADVLDMKYQQSGTNSHGHYIDVHRDDKMLIIRVFAA